MVRIIQVDIEQKTICTKDIAMGTSHGSWKCVANEMGCRHLEYWALSHKYGAFVDVEPSRLCKAATVFGFRLQGCLLIFK